MTDFDLGVLAKDGDPWAVNELLRRALPGVRAVVRKGIFRSSTTYDVYDDAVSEGLLAVWRSIPAWAKDPRVSLVTFARLPIIRAALRVAAEMGHATRVPQDEVEATQDARQNAVQRARGMTEAAGEFTYEEILAATPAPVEERIDIINILGHLREKDARLLWRIANDETPSEIGAETDSSKQCIDMARKRALERARTVISRRRAV